MSAPSSAPPRGRLTIFLGYAAGVGKTYQMLTEAHALRDRGVDVVVGYFEPHGRAETIALTAGLELIAREQPDFAFVDIGLPGMDGFAVATSLRDRVPDLRTRLVALTGYGNTQDRDRTRAAGYETHLIKPTPISEILAVLAGR